MLDAARIVDPVARAEIVEPVRARRDACAAPASAYRPAARAPAPDCSARSSSALRKPRSNIALCAISGASPRNVDQLVGDLVRNSGLSLRKSDDRPCTLKAASGMSRSGLK